MYLRRTGTIIHSVFEDIYGNQGKIRLSIILQAEKEGGSYGDGASLIGEYDCLY